jgi:hypothetical protein
MKRGAPKHPAWWSGKIVVAAVAKAVDVIDAVVDRPMENASTDIIATTTKTDVDVGVAAHVATGVVVAVQPIPYRRNGEWLFRF